MLTLFALVTTLFWLPEPERPYPRAVAFLTVEKEYPTGNWTLEGALGLLVPVSLGTLTLAFWRRSLLYGLVVLNYMVLTRSHGASIMAAIRAGPVAGRPREPGSLQRDGSTRSVQYAREVIALNLSTGGPGIIRLIQAQ
jgi:hypothetical protein